MIYSINFQKSAFKILITTFIRYLSCLFLIVLPCTLLAQSSTITYTFEHPEKVYELPNHQTSTFKQEVERISDEESILRVSIADRYPEIKSVYPIINLSPEMQDYIEATSHIQSDAPEIERIAKMIKDSTDFGNSLWHLVSSTLSWSRSVLRYGKPSEIPTALDAYHDGVANCIGFVHLPASVLRNMGIPTRVVRTFMVRGSRLTRHYLLEVYFPDDDTWVTFEPQTLRPPMKGNVAVFIDNNWNPSKHVSSRNFSTDPQTRVRHGLPYQVKPTDEIGQLPRPDWNPYTGQKCVGLALAGYGDDFAAVAFGEPSPGPAMNPEAQFQEAEIIFYQPTDEGYNMQVFIPEDYAEGEFISRGQDAGSWSEGKFTISGTRGSKFATPNLHTRIFMSDQWAVVRFIGLLGIPAQDNIPIRDMSSGRGPSGNTKQRGMLMVFNKKPDGQWAHHQNIFNPYTGESNHFGDEVDFSDNTMFVSAAFTRVENSYAGEVLVYKLSDDQTWQFVEALKPDEQISGDELRARDRGHFHMRFGHKIAVDEKRLVVADINGLHFYERVGGMLNKEKYLSFDFSENKSRTNRFGGEGNTNQKPKSSYHASDSLVTSLSLDGSRVAAGFGNFHTKGDKSGAVMVFEREHKQWMQTAFIAPEEIQSTNQFGMNVVLKGNQLFASAHHMGTSLGERSGGVFVFEPLENDLWVSTAFLRASNMINNLANPEPFGKGAENVGFSMALLNDKLLASAPGLYNRNPYKNWGGIYEFPIPERAFELKKKQETVAAKTEIRNLEPNPTFSVSELDFSIEGDTDVSIYLIDQNGEKILFKNAQALSSGIYTLGLDLLEVEPGSYELVLETQFGKNHFDLLRVSRLEIESIE